MPLDRALGPTEHGRLMTESIHVSKDSAIYWPEGNNWPSASPTVGLRRRSGESMGEFLTAFARAVVLFEGSNQQNRSE